MKQGFWFLLIVSLFTPLVVDGSSRRNHEVFFEGTDQELHVYRVYGEKPGPTMFIIGGIHNEPGSYLTADKYVDYSLKQGNLIVIPRANLLTIHQDHRGIHGDMNRKFGSLESSDSDYQIVEILKKYIQLSDVLLNLHDGHGFYRPSHFDRDHNPSAWGQAIIADTDKIYSERHKREYNLREIGERVALRVNEEFGDPKYRDFQVRFKNTRTASEDSIHKEQRKSATYYALTSFDIPAFGIETSKNLPTDELKVLYQTAMVNNLMEEFEIIPYYPNIEVEKPKLEFLLIRINQQPPMAIKDGETLTVSEGDKITIENAYANYQRGLVVDLLGQGTFNDLNKEFSIQKSTKILVKKDKYPCGEVRISINKAVHLAKTVAQEESAEPKIKYFLIKKNQELLTIPTGSTFSIIEGDNITLVDLIMEQGDAKELVMNFRGFVAQTDQKNLGEDRGIPIRSSIDLIPRFAKSRSGELVYEIAAERGKEEVAKIFCQLEQPQVRYLFIEQDGKRVALRDKEVLSLPAGTKIKLLDVDLNTSQKQDVKVNFKGFAPTQDDNSGEDRGREITLDPKQLLSRFSVDGKGRDYEIVITQNSKEIGRSIIRLTD
ncbi:MAG TPA: M14/M99 family metallopeptidase [Bdellovibrionota bacterium]|nr:M14/M99 family metallopeptidase [Bdellovibrionota bacterium]